MSLPPKRPKRVKRTGRWRSQAHLKHVRSFGCAICWGTDAIEAAHVSMGSDAGMGRKASDYYAVPLCASCHRTGPKAQHTMGEPAFWAGQNVKALIAELIRTSPRRREIEAHKQETGNG